MSAIMNKQNKAVATEFEQNAQRQNAPIFGDIRALENPHHRDLIENFYTENPDIPSPHRALYVFSSWSQLQDNPHLTSEDCVFVDGGILETNIDLGNAIVVDDGGIRNGVISCGRFFADGGITSKRANERLRSKNTPPGGFSIPKF